MRGRGSGQLERAETGSDQARWGRGELETDFAKCFFLVPASLAVQGDIMLSVGETIEGFLLSVNQD